VCFAVTGDGTVPETLYTIDLTTAATVGVALGNGSDGEAIAFGADGYLYRHRGSACPTSTRSSAHRHLHERHHADHLSGFDTQEVLSAPPWVGGNQTADLYDNPVTNTNGVVRQLGTGLRPREGDGVHPVSNPQPFFRTCWACGRSIRNDAAALQQRCASPSQTVQLNMLLAPYSIGVLGIDNVDLRSRVLPCQIQILRCGPRLFSFATTPSGTWTLPWCRRDCRPICSSGSGRRHERHHRLQSAQMRSVT
jgi:hypothetical protein